MLLAGISSSRLPRPLPRIRTTQLHGDRRWQGPGGGNEQYYTATFPSIPPPRRQAPEYFSLDVEDVPAAGSRPDHLAGFRPQERVQRHAVEQIGDSAPFLPSLDVPVSLMGEQMVEVYKLLDVAVPEQVIDVPKISTTSLRDSRYVIRSWRNRWWKCRRRPLLSFLRRAWRTSLWKCRRSCLTSSRSRFSRVRMDTVGRRSLENTGVYWWRVGTSHTQWTSPPGYSARPGRDRNTGPGWLWTSL